MSESVEIRIREFTLQFKDRLPVDVVGDVLDWANHREWLLALEVFAEKSHELGMNLDAREWRQLSDLVAQSGGEIERFRFIEPFEP